MLTITELRQTAILLTTVILLVLIRDAKCQAVEERTEPNDIVYADIQQGAMKGVKIDSRLGRKIFAFRGIPYAMPPVGPLRFQAPVPARAWIGELDATGDAPECIQKNYLLWNANVTGQEDCLYLNVYTPKMSPPYSLFPVMVYIHGGGFFSGTGASYFNGPEFLLDKDVVLVTFNYRLGAMGFLSTGTSAAPGNAGFKDQTEVLKWVNVNIAAFGGDPTCVTLFGQSAGAASVHLHMLSPLSAGLFHRAITESGSALNAWAKPVDPWPIAEKQARLVNCTTSSPEMLITCLQGIDAVRLVDSADNFHQWSVDPLTTFRPVVEHNGAAFLTDDPTTLINSGNFRNIPWMSGVVSAEGTIRAVPILNNETLLTDLNSRPNELFPFLMELPASVKKSSRVTVAEVWRNVSNFYFGTDNAVINEDNHQKFIDLYSDRSMIQGFYKSTFLHSQAGHRKQYLYYFNYRGLYSYTALFARTLRNYGVSHCDDLIYLFSTPILFPTWQNNHPDLQVVENLVTLWTTFAKHGQPTLEISGQQPQNTSSNNCTGPEDISWQPYNSKEHCEQLRFLNISAAPSGSSSTLQFCMQTGFLQDRINFWESLPLIENERGLNILHIPHVDQLIYYFY